MLQNVTHGLDTKKSLRNNQCFNRVIVIYIYNYAAVFSTAILGCKIHSWQGNPLPAVIACGKLQKIWGKLISPCGNGGESVGKNGVKNKNCKAVNA